MAAWTRVLLFVTLGLISAKILLEINKAQPSPYMDEIFHVPQAQNYCHGFYDHWNPKITTLPGIYFASNFLLLTSSLSTRSDIKDVCDTFNLRCTNLVFAVLIYFTFYKLLKLLQRETVKTSDEKTQKTVGKNDFDNLISVKAFNLTLFPLLYFNAFLYYTDVGSTFLVLLTYYLSLKERNILSSLCGIVAILFRQTNVVWVGFSCAANVLVTFQRKQIYKKNDNLITIIHNCLGGVFTNFIETLLTIIPYILVLFGFLVFVVLNQGIVVGDRTAHEASVNIPQMFYFAIFTMIFSCFLLLRYMSVKRITHEINNLSLTKLFMYCMVILFMIFAVHYFTYVHKYLLSDNRHYPFYVWRKLYQRHWSVKYGMIPLYAISWYIILKELTQRCNMLWVFVFILCTAAVLVPQKLLEFRYFIVPYLLVNLHIELTNKYELLVEFLTYTMINIVTFYLFIHRPFQWPTSNDIQRFMW